MDQLSTGESARDTAQENARSSAKARRGRVRAQSLARRAVAPEPDRYETPEWLDRSFVLPLTQPETDTVPADLPTQSVPQHDHLPVAAPVEATSEPVAEQVPERTLSEPAFVRPPSDEIDFAAVIRRSDVSRAAGRVSWLSVGLAGLALIGFLLTMSPYLLGVLTVVVLIGAAGLVTRARLTKAPIPRLQR